jgi:hypothetical protein
MYLKEEKEGLPMVKKILLAGLITVLFAGLIISPATAQLTQTDEASAKESGAIERFMDDVEIIATTSQSFSEFIEKLQTLCLTNDYIKYPIVQDLVARMLDFLTKERAFSGTGLNLLDLLGTLSSKLGGNFFVLSYGAYHRLNPRKDNSIDRFKERLSMWRYSDTAKLIKGRTLTFERQPFGLHQKIVGPQLGFMKGFKGIFIDIESKLTGNSYVFFIGKARRIHAFDLTPLSK